MLELCKAVVSRGAFTLSADLTVTAGARVAVIGGSGSGKSTLLSLIAGFLHPTQGSILWNGQDLVDTPPGQRPISMLFQDHNLFPHLSVFQNVGLGMRSDLRLSAAQKLRISQVLEEVGLPGFESRLPTDLSGGQQSRVALARVVLRARPILLLDEPFAALGPAMRSEMLDLLARIALETGTTVLIVSHNPDDARQFAPETILVEDGTALPPQPTKTLLNNPPPGLRAYLG